MGSPPEQSAGERSTARGRAVLLALRLYLRELRRHGPLTAGGMLLPALGNTCMLYVAPLAVAALAGRVVQGAGVAEATPLLLAFGGVLLFAELLWRVGIHCLNRVDGRGIEHLSVFGFDALLAKDASFFHTNFAGSLTKRVLGFAGRFEEFTDALVFSVVAKVVPLGFACVVLWGYHPALVVVLLGLIAVTGVAVAPLVRRRQRLVDAREAAYARVSGHVADVLSNVEAVRAFGAEEREGAEHRRRAAESRALALRSWDYGNLRVDVLVAPMSVLTNVLGLVVAVWASGGLGLEALLVTFTYYGNATRIMFEFNHVYRRLEGSLTEAAQFTELLLDEPTVVDAAEPEPTPTGDSRVSFDGVAFAHPGAPPLFTGLDLDIPAGTRVGLVGRSGGGKTTLTRLLLRLSDVDGGSVRIGGQDISRVRQAELRGLIAYVPQDPSMLHRTLRENIAFARPGASEAEIQRAARAAHVTEFARELPEGFDTVVGERGVKLSGGQRQRVALARAILRDAPILLLDEATSALDSESEALVQRALWRLLEGRTALVVAHRLSTVVRMDRLVVLDRGRVVEQGTHAELLDAGGAYARLWRHQSGGFLDEATSGKR
ncbi:ABC transporter ATP-binding protein [Actinosynnema mirum]|uniref:Fatty acid ABC transporter ATP-binding/permease protein n=1 Tax=Actinosynnema mirum (strain ATCC 29888 / DSM 43827 / JCM 3225 / NBRC 14064 / NCIMB 13271 / NRRL B-12336 / IMRU 3971 / 101) TaxID=446462 RepID=C6WC11_ACTMD|nr:ABC transporter ATP-binding protein [Actinosynnema mirum]ACU37578.1 ABC transporter related [Actinosynnema mirum DSM 43827]